MSKKPNKKKDKDNEPEIHCPKCGGMNLEYTPEKRRVPSPWYVHVGALAAIVVFAFFMPAFSVAFVIVYIYYTLRKQPVLVGTCQDCGEETLFNQPEDGSLTPKFNQPWK